MHSVRAGLLQNRKAAFVVMLCLALVTLQSWRGITRPTAFPSDIVHLFGLAFAIFITTSIAWRSPFSADRVVFAAVTAALVLGGITAVWAMGSSGMLVISAAKSLLWTTGAVVTATVVIRSIKD